MHGSRWLEARDALAEIAEYALKLNVRTVSLRFLNDGTYDRGLQVSSNPKLNSLVQTHFYRVHPRSCRGLIVYSQTVPVVVIISGY